MNESGAPKKPSIHGVEEISNASSRFGKVFWVSILTAAIALLLVGIWNVFSQYLNQKPLTIVELTSIQAYPFISLCPELFVDERKFSALGFDAGDYGPFGGLFEKPLSSFDNSDKLHNSRFHAKVRNLPFNLDLLMEKISYDIANDSHTASLVSDLETKKPLNVTRHFTARGVCYKVSIPDNQRKSSEDLIMVEMERPKKLFDLELPGSDQVIIRFGDQAEFPAFTLGYTTTMLNDLYINLKASRITKADNCKNNWSQLQYLMCRYEETEKRRGTPPYYFPGRYCTIDNITTHLQSCTGVACKEFQEERSEEEISQACREPCESWMFEASSWLLSPQKNESDKFGVVFHIPPSGTSLAMTEYAITPDNLIGDIGGQLGLWTGLSAIALIQSLVALCTKARKWKAKMPGKVCECKCWQKSEGDFITPTGQASPLIRRRRPMADSYVVNQNDDLAVLSLCQECSRKAGRSTVRTLGRTRSF